MGALSPEGAHYVSPGQSAAPPWVHMATPGRSPERAKLRLGLMRVVSPFQGLVFVIMMTQGGAARLTTLRSALG